MPDDAADSKPDAPRPVTDSPWLWLVLFLAAAIGAVLVVTPKYAHRQGRLERMNETRQAIARRDAGAPVSAESEEEEYVLAPTPAASGSGALGPLVVVLSLLLALSAVAAGIVSYLRATSRRNSPAPREPVMSWLVEDPTPTLVAIALIVAVLTIALVKTGRGSFLFAIAGVALLGGALLALEWLVITDKETVEDTLAAASKALEANDAQALSAFIAPESPMRNEVAREMQRVTISKASWSRLEVKFNHYTSPPSAEADFMGYINAKDRRGEMPYENFAGRIVVQLRKENDRWVMTGYEMPGRR